MSFGSIAGQLRAAGSALGVSARGHVPDVLLIGGVGGIAYGAWLVYAPAGFIVGGLFLLVGGVLGARRGG